MTDDIRLAVFDMAGTTVSDDGVVEASFVDAMTTVGLDVNDEHMAHVRATMGMSKIVVFEHLLGGDQQRARSANTAFEAAYERRLALGEVQPIDGVADFLADLRASGIKVCLTTGFSAPTQLALLEALKWVDAADLALTPGPGRRGRPYPDLVLSAVMALEVDDVRQVAVAGDTANDLLAGWRAGASVVAGVLTGVHGLAELTAAPHTHVLGEVTELRPILLG